MKVKSSKQTSLKKGHNTTEKVLKEISSGKYRDHYLIYNRKSTDESENQKNSISFQGTENARFAQRTLLPIAPVTLKNFCTDGIVSERHSGFKESDDLHVLDDGVVQYRIDRPKFQQIVQHLSRGHFKGIICLCWDRISRNKGDDTIIRKLMRKGVDVRFVYANYDDGSAGELHMDIDGMFSQHHSRVTSEKVRLTLKNSRAKGKCTYRAPIGYLNTGSMDHKPLDPERAPILKEMFELYSTGDWSLADLERYGNEQGLMTAPTRRRRTKEEILSDREVEIEKTSRPVSKNLISRILTNKFYTGRVIGVDGTYVQSTSHEALVSDELFNQVQNVLNQKQVSVHYTEKLDHPLRGVVRCGLCDRVYTPYEKKGILYFNSRCRAGCTNTPKNCNFDFIADKVRDLISTLHFTDDELAELDARASTDISLLEEKRAAAFQKLERKKKNIRDNLAYLRSNRLSLLKTGVYTPEGIVEEQQGLENRLESLQEEEQISDTAMQELIKEVTTLSELIKNVTTIYDSANPYEKEAIIKCIFSELKVSQGSLSYKAKKGFEAFEPRIGANCGLIAWLSELSANREHIRSNITALAEITNPE